MKNRDYKQFAPGEIYHVYNRGVGKMDIFKDLQDYKIFLLRMQENLFPERFERNKLSRAERRRKSLPPNSFGLICYCLMPNHFHMVIQQFGKIPVSTLILKICTSYSMYFNKKYKRVGTLFQDQFKAVLIESNEQLIWTSFYVHKNPIEAGLVDNVSDYKWSSFQSYKNSPTSISLCKEGILIDQFKSKDNFIKHFYNSLNSKIAEYNITELQDTLMDLYD